MFFQERYNDFLWKKTKLHIYKEKYITFKGNWFFYDKEYNFYTIGWKKVALNFNNQPLNDISNFSYLFFRNKWHIIFFKKKKNKELKVSVPFTDVKNFSWNCVFDIVEWFIYEFENFSWEPLIHIDNILLLKKKEKDLFYYQWEKIYYLLTNIQEKDWNLIVDFLINGIEFKDITLENNFSTSTKDDSFSFLFSWKAVKWSFINKKEIFTKEKLSDTNRKYVNTFLYTLHNFSFHWLYYNYLENKLYNLDKIFNDCLENEEIKAFIERMKWLQWQFSDKNFFYRDSVVTDINKDWIQVSFFLFFNHFFAWRDINKLKNYLSSIPWVDTTLIPKFTFNINFEKVLWLVFQIDVQITSDELSLNKIYGKITTEDKYKDDLDCYNIRRTFDVLMFNDEELKLWELNKINPLDTEQLKIPTDHFLEKHLKKYDIFTKKFKVETYFWDFEDWTNFVDFDTWHYFNNSKLLDKKELLYYYYDDKYIEYQNNHKIMYFVE